MWQVIKDFENYSVSTLGEIRNNKTGRMLTPSPGAGGYLRVNLRKDKTSYQRYVHRLVAEAFLEGEGEVNHLDGNRANNTLANLEWVSHQENIRHSFDVLNREPGRGRVGVRVEYVDGTIKEFSTVKECSQYYNIDPGTIRDYVNHRLTKHRQIQANFYYIKSL